MVSVELLAWEEGGDDLRLSSDFSPTDCSLEQWIDYSYSEMMPHLKNTSDKLTRNNYTVAQVCRGTASHPRVVCEVQNRLIGLECSEWMATMLVITLMFGHDEV